MYLSRRSEFYSFLTPKYLSSLLFEKLELRSGDLESALILVGDLPNFFGDFEF